jgi:heme-degrading monooxygenase HmoA
MNENKTANTPEPPYYAVIFTSLRSDIDEGYSETAESMAQLVQKQQGYLGHESFRDENGFGVTISYWQSLEDIENWKKNPVHLPVQKKGREKWYKHYKVRICKVERDYRFDR